MEVFLVVTDGYQESYGSSNYCVGVFTTREAAEKAMKNEDEKGNFSSIVPLILDTYYPTEKNELNNNHSNMLYVGGYIE